MWKLHFLLGIAFVICFQARLIQSQCTTLKNLNGSIVESLSIDQSYTKCWKIQVPSGQFAKLQVHSLNLYKSDCSNAYLRITVNGSNENYTFCNNEITRNPITALMDVQINVNCSKYSWYDESISFDFSYEIQDIECAREGSFHCTYHTCIPRDQVCDGVKNCRNGADEVQCETGVISISGVAQERAKAIAWLKSRRTASWGWHENTPRAVTALFLSGGANFNGTNLEEELMAKQTELRTSVALLKTSIPNEELSMFINALLVTCHNPRRFYGQNLVKQLKEQMSSSNNFTHPITYLSLCNANETWPFRANTDLLKIFSSNSDYPFVRDLQAFAVMAVACNMNNTKVFNQTVDPALLNEYKRTVKYFKEHQESDGSFGNVHTTALVAQALLASGNEHSRDWKLNTTVKHLFGEMNSSRVEFFSVYLTLPVLNGKSLSDVFKVDCSSHPRKHEDDLVSDITDFPGPKMRVEYSLFVGNEKDVVHTISLLVPENYTAYDVMQVAEVEDPKYNFEWKTVSNKIYIYRIGKITNDSEGGKFWLLYLRSNNTTQHFTTSPDKLPLEDGNHLIMWYKSAEI